MARALVRHLGMASPGTVAQGAWQACPPDPSAGHGRGQRSWQRLAAKHLLTRSGRGCLWDLSKAQGPHTHGCIMRIYLSHTVSRGICVCQRSSLHPYVLPQPIVSVKLCVAGCHAQVSYCHAAITAVNALATPHGLHKVLSFVIKLHWVAEKPDRTAPRGTGVAPEMISGCAPSHGPSQWATDLIYRTTINTDTCV